MLASVWRSIEIGDGKRWFDEVQRKEQVHRTGGSQTSGLDLGCDDTAGNQPKKTWDLEWKDLVFPSQLFTKHLLLSLLENTVLVIKRGIRNCSHLHMRQTLPHEERILKRHGQHVAEFLTKAVERKEGKVTNSAANLDKIVNSSVSSFVRMGLIPFTTQSSSDKLNKLICRNCF